MGGKNLTTGVERASNFQILVEGGRRLTEHRQLGFPRWGPCVRPSIAAENSETRDDSQVHASGSRKLRRETLDCELFVCSAGLHPLATYVLIIPSYH